MAQITSYATLQSHIADTLNRSDLTSVIPNFIQQFEARARSDWRLRKLDSQSVVNVASDGLALPSDLYRLNSWYHDGATYFGPIAIVSADDIGRLKASYGDTGVPQFAAIVDGVARFAPEPDATYVTKIVYERYPDALSATNTSNYLLEEAPDIYLYGCLAESAPYLKDDERLGMWETMFNQRAENYNIAQQDAAFGGSIIRQYTPFGG